MRTLTTVTPFLAFQGLVMVYVIGFLGGYEFWKSEVPFLGVKIPLCFEVAMHCEISRLNIIFSGINVVCQCL